VDEIAALFQGFKYNRESSGGFSKDARGDDLAHAGIFMDAGHAWSAGIMVRGQKETLFYTGRRLVRRTRPPEGRAGLRT